MSLLVTFGECGHPQILMEVGENPPSLTVPHVLYPLDTGTSVDPGDMMTCITCDETRTVRTAV